MFKDLLDMVEKTNCLEFLRALSCCHWGCNTKPLMATPFSRSH